MADARVTAQGSGVRFAVRVQPRASKNEVVGVHGESIRIRVTAAPVDGSANEALIDFLSELFARPARSIRIVGGARSRSKIVEVDGISVDDVHRLLATPG
jgi:uncharacterized protein (TIGR00251 family)